MSDKGKEKFVYRNDDGGFLLMVGVAIGLVFGFLIGLGVGEGNKDIGWQKETRTMGLSEFYVDERNIQRWRWKKNPGTRAEPEKEPQGEQDVKDNEPPLRP